MSPNQTFATWQASDATVTLALDQEDAHKKSLDVLYRSLENEAEFSPEEFARSSSAMLKQTDQ